MKRFCLALDLVDDPELITAYEHWHQQDQCWPEIPESIKRAGIRQMEIYRTGNRLFMIMETEDDFSFEKKAALDAANPKVRAWEDLMSQFQQPLPWNLTGGKWLLMNKIFNL